MRDIEFRAWNKCAEKYFYGNEIATHDGLTISDIFEDDGYVFEQYTGLKDKYGVKIFEGDILRSNHFLIEGEQHYLHHFIAWSEQLLGWLYVNKMHFKKDLNVKILEGSPQLFVMRSKIAPQNIVVVGNIHENPELLELA